MPEPNLPKHNNSTKALGGALVILAMIGGVTAIVRPMQQSLDDLRKDTEIHELAKGHPPAIAALAAVKVEFKEVETQFRAMRDLVEHLFAAAQSQRDRTDVRVTEQSKVLRELEGLLLRTNERLKSNIEQMAITASWIREHDLRIPGIDSAQWERIKALERQVYGKAGDVTIGEGSGAK